MNLAAEFHPYGKEKSLQKNKIKFNQREKGEISQKVRDIVNARTIFAPVGCCERCKKNRNGFWRLELAHIDSRNFIEHKTTDTDLLRLCAPSNESGTCHHWVDSCEKGFEWMKEQQIKLLEDKSHV